MTRRSAKSRTSRPPAPGIPYRAAAPSLRQRKPLAFWLAILGVVALVSSTVASFLRVIL